MANLLDSNGLFLEDRAFWVDFFNTKFQEIYGPDVNLASDTPDGQLIGIVVQVILDLQDLLRQVYSSFDPDNAIGKTLDQRVAINGIQRQGGTYTVTPITLVNDRSINLYGLDQDEQPVYTIADAEGNQFQLQETELGLAAGSHVLNFRAAVPGEVLTTPNTITSPVTVVLGVVSVNNPSTALTTGVNEESDAALKIRRAKSTSIGGQGYHDALVAALLNIPGVTDAKVYENNTGSTDADGIPSHSIWVIISGSADDDAIAEAIYEYRNAGCGMRGDEIVYIEQVDGSIMAIKFDYFVAQPVFIKFSASSINGEDLPNIAGIVEQLPELLAPALGDTMNINEVATKAQEVDPNALITQAGLSDGREQTISLSGVAASGTFKFVYAGEESAAVNWNDSIGTIQSKLQAVAGLENALVTGSIASQSLVIDLSDVATVAGIVYLTDNSLATSGPVDITPAYDLNWQDTLEPFSKRNQFVLNSDFIIVTPMQLLPAATSVAAETTVSFAAYGGYAPYTYSISIDNSGATIDPVTGEYESGVTPSVTDTVLVTDALGNTATAEVDVVA